MHWFAKSRGILILFVVWQKQGKPKTMNACIQRFHWKLYRNKKIIRLLLYTILSKDYISNATINKILLRKVYCSNKPCLWYWIQWLCGSHRYDTNLVHVFVENKAAVLGEIYASANTSISLFATYSAHENNYFNNN